MKFQTKKVLITYDVLKPEKNSYQSKYFTAVVLNAVYIWRLHTGNCLDQDVFNIEPIKNMHSKF